MANKSAVYAAVDHPIHTTLGETIRAAVLPTIDKAIWSAHNSSISPTDYPTNKSAIYATIGATVDAAFDTTIDATVNSTIESSYDAAIISAFNHAHKPNESAF